MVGNLRCPLPVTIVTRMDPDLFSPGKCFDERINCRKFYRGEIPRYGRMYTMGESSP